MSYNVTPKKTYNSYNVKINPKISTFLIHLQNDRESVIDDFLRTGSDIHSFPIGLRRSPVQVKKHPGDGGQTGEGSSMGKGASRMEDQLPLSELQLGTVKQPIGRGGCEYGTARSLSSQTSS